MTNILINTPIWVYILFIFLVYLGVSQTKDRKKTFFKALILPLIMMALSLLGLLKDFSLSLNIIQYYLLGFISGIIINYVTKFSSNILYIKKEGTFLVRGSFKPLILIMCIFFTKYIVGYLNAIDSQLIYNISFLIFVPILYGLYSGLFFGRVLSMINIRNKNDSID